MPRVRRRLPRGDYRPQPHRNSRSRHSCGNHTRDCRPTTSRAFCRAAAHRSGYLSDAHRLCPSCAIGFRRGPRQRTFLMHPTPSWQPGGEYRRHLRDGGGCESGDSRHARRNHTAPARTDRAADITAHVSHYLTKYYLSQETNAAQAGELAMYELIAAAGGIRSALSNACAP